MVQILLDFLTLKSKDAFKQDLRENELFMKNVDRQDLNRRNYSLSGVP